MLYNLVAHLNRFAPVVRTIAFKSILIKSFEETKLANVILTGPFMAFLCITVAKFVQISCFDC